MRNGQCDRWAGNCSSAHDGVERTPAVVLAADECVVPGARVHRQPRLGRVEPVVGVDQGVHLVERPRLNGGRPRSRECVVIETGGEQLLPGRPEPAFVLCRLLGDRPQPNHVRQRAPERGEVSIGRGTEVEEPKP